MSHTGIDYITDFEHRVITADHIQWRKHAAKNFDKVLQLVMLFSNEINPKCIFCGRLSLNYSSIATLSRHYKGGHKNQVIEYYIENITKIEPEKIIQLSENRKMILGTTIGEIKNC